MTTPAPNWDDAPVLEHRPVEEVVSRSGERLRTCRWNDTVYGELIENGLGALVGWVFDPARLLRVRAPEPPPVKVVWTTPIGTHTEYVPRTSEDQTVIDDDIDQYLLEAHAPPRPRGYLWLVPLPPDTDVEQFWMDLHAALAQHDIRFPAEYADALRTILNEPPFGIVDGT
jgi:uncharacterized protein DUF5956